MLRELSRNPEAFRQNSDETGYILEVDLDYPDALHDCHSDMPLAPEHIEICKDDICPFMQENCPYSKTYKSRKLIGTLSSKRNYVLHYQMLRFYMSLGLKVAKVHRVLVFNQEPFMQEYISHLASLRSKSKNEFEKSCLKKLANSNYGKMIEDVRKYKEVKICQTRNSLLKAMSSPFFENFKIYNEKLVICFQKKKCINLKSCHAIGLSILDLSKLHMYDLYYNYIIPETELSPTNGSLRIMMSDTDSFLFAFKNKTTKQFLQDIEPIMDFSNYQKDDQMYSRKRAGQLGYLKDEMKGAGIEGVVALKSKCYSIKTKEKSLNKCKGIPKVATNKLQFKHYKKSLFSKAAMSSTFPRISSKDHRVTTTSFTRKSLSCYDDKRFYLCSLHSMPYGHYKLKNKNLKCIFH